MGAICIGVKAGHTHAIFSRQEGGLISFRVKGLETIEKVPTLEFSVRQPTMTREMLSL